MKQHRLHGEMRRIERALTLAAGCDRGVRVGLVKQPGAIAMMQPQRIGMGQARAAAFPTQDAWDPPCLHALLDLISAGIRMLERSLIDGTTASIAK